MKRNKKFWILIGGVVLFCLICVTLCPLTNGSITFAHVYAVDWYCPITKSQASEYQVMSEEREVTSFTCNTSDMQEATATFNDGAAASFFIEYDGQYVSWSAPQGYECLGDWNSAGAITVSGTEAVKGHPETVGVICKGNGNLIIMNGLLTPPAPGNNL